MMSLLDIFGGFFDKLFVRLTNELPIPIVLMLLLGFSTLYKPEWLAPLPSWIIIPIWLVLIPWTATILIQKRFQHIRSLEQAGGDEVSYPEEDYKEHGSEDYAGVKWKIRIPRYHSPVSIEDIPPSDIEVCFPARCPVCKTELEQRKSFWCGFIWNCVGCGFKKRSARSLEEEASRLEMLLRRQLEQAQEELEE